MDKDKNQLELEGTVVFIQMNAGSKSEAIQPVLYINENEYHQLYMENSNPFENNELRKFDGRKVNVKGVIENNKLTVFEINEIA